MSTSIHSLPPEICYHFTGFLSDDIASLCACSLACRALQSFCQTYLFRSITIQNRTQAVRLANVVNDDQGMLANHVRHVRISASEKFPYGKIAIPTIDDLLPFCVSQKLRHVHTLNLSDFDMWREVDIKSLLNLTSVTTLTLSHCGVSVAECLSIVSALPSLATLRLAHCKFWPPPAGIPEALPCVHVPPLKSLHISSFGTAHPLMLEFIAHLVERGPQFSVTFASSCGGPPLDLSEFASQVKYVSKQPRVRVESVQTHDTHPLGVDIISPVHKS